MRGERRIIKKFEVRFEGDSALVARLFDKIIKAVEYENLATHLPVDIDVFNEKGEREPFRRIRHK